MFVLRLSLAPSQPVEWQICYKSDAGNEKSNKRPGISLQDDVPYSMDGWNSRDSPWKTWRENMESIQQTHMWKSCFASHLSVQVLKFMTNTTSPYKSDFFALCSKTLKQLRGEFLSCLGLNFCFLFCSKIHHFESNSQVLWTSTFST